jgi:hypothetical protein
MKKIIAGLCALVMLGGAQVRAGLVYDNGPPLGPITFSISNGDTITDSFTVSSATSLAGAKIAVVGDSVGTPLTVDWSIGTSAFGSEVSSGTGTLYNTYTGPATIESTFSLSGSLFAGTTYWLTLQNATTSDGSALTWWESDGPSTAYAYNGTLGSIPSESFQLYDAAVPEPPSILTMVLGVAAVGLVRYGWRRRNAVSA